METRIDVLPPANEKDPQLFVDMGQAGKRKLGFGKPFGGWAASFCLTL